MTPTKASGRDDSESLDRSRAPQGLESNRKGFAVSIGKASHNVNVPSPQTDSSHRHTAGKRAANERPYLHRVLRFVTPWLAMACGFFGILVINTHLITGIIAIAVCGTILLPRWGNG